MPTAYPFTLYTEIYIPIEGVSGNAITFGNTSVSNNYFDIEYYNNKWVIVNRANGTVIAHETSTNPTVGWHKVAGIFTSTNLYIYVDGVLAGSRTHSVTFNTNINDLLLGQLRTVGDTGSRNSIKEAIVFNTELSSAEAIALTTL